MGNRLNGDGLLGAFFAAGAFGLRVAFFAIAVPPNNATGRNAQWHTLGGTLTI